MAGTPTPNYNIPTYADTDAPDLSGAYNDAMGIIDTQLKANADATDAKQDKLTAGTGIEIQGNEISATATGGTEYTGTAPVNVSGSTISVAYSTPEADGSAKATGGIVRVNGKSSDISATSSITDTAVPNNRAVYDYVQSAMAAAGAAYTGTAPIVVNNGDHAISVNVAGDYTWSGNEVSSIGTRGVVGRINLPNANVAQRIDTQTADYWTRGEPSFAVPTVATLKAYVALHTPNASTSAKGLVQLTTSPASADSTMAVTGSGVVRLLGDRKTNATTNVTVDMLKNLYVDNTTGVVYYKAPTE